MKAITYRKYGGQLTLEELPRPVPKDDEVLVKVHAVSINDWDFAMLDGNSLFNRMTSGFNKPKRLVLGSDIAGTVEEAGKEITQFKPGDEVYGDLSGAWGGFAEYVCAKEKALCRKPANMSFIDAAAIPQAGMLAVQGLIDKGKIAAGQKVLVNGAGGGVGTFAIQLARLYGVEITGVDHTNKLAMLREIGFDHVLDYTKEDFTKNGRQYDLILDVKTNRSPYAYARALSRGGIYATVGGSLGKLLLVFLLGPLISKTHKKHVRVVALKVNKDLPYINKLYDEGKLRPVIDGPYPLDKLPQAMEIFARGEHKGKVVITI